MKRKNPTFYNYGYHATKEISFEFIKRSRYLKTNQHPNFSLYQTFYLFSFLLQKTLYLRQDMILKIL